MFLKPKTNKKTLIGFLVLGLDVLEVIFKCQKQF